MADKKLVEVIFEFRDLIYCPECIKEEITPEIEKTLPDITYGNVKKADQPVAFIENEYDKCFNHGKKMKFYKRIKKTITIEEEYV